MLLRKILGHIIDCKRATYLISRTQEHPLGRLNGLLLKLHLAWCVACLRFEGQMRFLRQAMHKYRE
jgi:hypothetical protein